MKLCVPAQRNPTMPESVSAVIMRWPNKATWSASGAFVEREVIRVYWTSHRPGMSVSALRGDDFGVAGLRLTASVRISAMRPFSIATVAFFEGGGLSQSIKVALVGLFMITRA